jgi:hypothetical protein
MVKNKLLCGEIQRRRGGAKKPNGDKRGGIEKVVLRPFKSQIFAPRAINLLLRSLIGHGEVSVVDGSNAQSSAELGNRVTVIVVARCVLNCYRHLFGNLNVRFLVVNHPRDEDPAIHDVLRRIKTGTIIWLVTGDTKPDPIMNGAQNAADRGCRVHIFTRHHNTSTTGKWNMFHKACSVHAQKASKGGSLIVHGVCDDGTPKATSDE